MNDSIFWPLTLWILQKEYMSLDRPNNVRHCQAFSFAAAMIGFVQKSFHDFEVTCKKYGYFFLNI